MKNAVMLLMAVLLLAGCSTTQKVFGGGGSSPGAAAPREMPETVKDEFNKGLTAYRNEQYVNAQEHFENVTKINPNIPEAHLDLALTLYQQGKTDQADKHFDEARRLYSKEFGMGGSRGTAPSGSNQGMSRSDQPS